MTRQLQVIIQHQAQGSRSGRDDTYIPLSPPARHNLSYVESKDEVERNHGGILVTVGADLLYSYNQQYL